MTNATFVYKILSLCVIWSVLFENWIAFAKGGIVTSPVFPRNFRFLFYIFRFNYKFSSKFHICCRIMFIDNKCLVFCMVIIFMFIHWRFTDFQTLNCYYLDFMFRWHTPFFPRGLHMNLKKKYASIYKYVKA